MAEASSTRPSISKVSQAVQGPLAQVQDGLERYFWPPTIRVEAAAGSGGEAVVIIGDRPSTRYFSQKFAGETAKDLWLGNTPIVGLSARLEDLCGKGDVVVGRLVAPVARALARRNALCAPLLVQAKLSLPLSDEKKARIHKTQRDNIRKIRKNGLRYEISTRAQDFDEFVDAYYRPFVLQRFKERAGVMSRRVMRHHFRRGAIMWIEKDGERVAGELFVDRAPVVRSIVAATKQGREEHVRAGALSATYLFMSQWAGENGYATLDWGGCDPSLASGVLMTKKRWGGAVYCKPYQRFGLVFSWGAFGPGVRRFFRETPLIIRDGKDLAGFCVLSTEDRIDVAEIRALARRYLMNGLKRLYVVTGQGAFPASPTKGDCDSPVWLVPPGPPGECLLSARPFPDVAWSDVDGRA
jgi:hypothetical protein